MATIARLVTVIEAQMQGFEKVSTQLETTINKMEGVASAAITIGQSLATMAAGAGVMALANDVRQFAGEMSDLSQQTGIGTERLQALNLVGQESGVTVENIANAVAQLSKRLVGGDAGAVEALEKLGLRARDIINLAPDLAFIRIGEALANIANPMERNAAAMELFGGSGARFLPMMTSQLGELVEQAEKSSAVIDGELIAKIDKFDDSLSLALAHTRAFAVDIVAFTADVSGLSRAFEDVSSLVNYVSQGNAMQDVMNRIKSPVMALGSEGLPRLSMSIQEADRVSRTLNESVKESIKVHSEAAQAAKRHADEHTKLQAIIGLGHMKAAQEFVEAMAIFKSETMAFNALIDEVGENFKNTWSQEVTATVVDGSRVAGEVLDELARHGMLVTEQATVTMGQYFRVMFADIATGVDTLMGMLADALGGRMGHILSQFQGAWRTARGVWQGILRGMSGDFSGWMDAIMGGISLIRAAWDGLSGLFRGGEEGTQVNPARDKFLSQWGDPSNKDVGGAGWNLAALLTQLGAGEGGGGLFAALQNAEKMAAFVPAARAIVEFLNSHGESASMNFHSGGMVPGTGEVPATLLGGERVLNRSEVGEMSGLLSELRQLRSDNARRDRVLTMAIRDAVLLAR